MFVHLFRILNFGWAALLAMGMILHYDQFASIPWTLAVFWAIYLLVSLGVFRDLRVAWVLCGIQLIAIWVLMGMMVSDRSFEFFTGASAADRQNITSAVINSFITIVAPTTLLLVLLIFSQGHVRWVFRDRALVQRERAARRRRLRNLRGRR
ncbi:MAG: hypothetical protein HKO59_18210 [Phycisphaerales bacterium]|nr:hypothetical protein [Phycisphaerales bacterium]NNM27872.1 hypothetical protein [Phycisphaerales bacterium]